MPKSKIQSEREARERAVMLAVARCQVELGFQYDLQVAGFLGMLPQFYGRYKRMKFQTPWFLLFCKMARQLGFTDREVCESVGIKYPV